MPPPVPRPGGRFRRFTIIALLLLVAAGVYAFVNLGRWLDAEDPLAKADAIVVLSGTLAERPLEAADLYDAGYAPRILVTRGLSDKAMRVAAERGAAVPSEAELGRQILLKLGVPETALIIPDRIHDNTAQEAQTLRLVAARYGWHRVIVVSSKYHLRRVKFALSRELKGMPLEVILRGSRYDESTPERWWTRRSDIRWLLSEVPKLAAYSLGLGA